MQESKNFKIILDNSPVAQVPILPSATIKQIKDFGKNYAKQMGKTDYVTYIYLDKVNKFDVTDTTEYDNLTISAAWDKIADGHLVLVSKNTKASDISLFMIGKDTLYSTALKLDGTSLLSLCLTNKELSKICADDDFWSRKLFQDYKSFLGTTEDIKRDKGVLTWKEYYKKIMRQLEYKLFKSTREFDLGGKRLLFPETRYYIGKHPFGRDPSQELPVRLNIIGTRQTRDVYTFRTLDTKVEDNVKRFPLFRTKKSAVEYWKDNYKSEYGALINQLRKGKYSIVKIPFFQ